MDDRVDSHGSRPKGSGAYLAIAIAKADYIKIHDSNKNWMEPAISIMPTFIGFIIFPAYRSVFTNGNKNGRHIHGSPRKIGRISITE